MNSKILFLLILIVTAACTTEREIIQPVKPDTLDSYLDHTGGSYLASTARDNVRYEESIKAYATGRYVDAGDNSVMHESGIIYRVENYSSWDLQPRLPAVHHFGKNPSTLKQENKELLQTEIEVKANEQRALYKYLKEAADQAGGQINFLEESANISRKLLEQNKLLKEKLENSEKEKEKLNENLLQLKEQVEVLLKYHRQKEVDTIKSKYRREP